MTTRLTNERLWELVSRSCQMTCNVTRDGDYEPNGGDPCSARICVISGRVHVARGCGRPCSFVREDAYRAQQEAERIKHYAALLGVG